MATTTSRAAIVAAARTAIGTARKGTLANTPATELAKPVVDAVVQRSGLGAAEFDDLVLAESMQGGGDSARYVAVDLGLTNVPGLAVNRQCASSLSAIAIGAGQIAAGMSRAVLAGGMESCSTAPTNEGSESHSAPANLPRITKPVVPTCPIHRPRTRLPWT